MDPFFSGALTGAVIVVLVILVSLVVRGGLPIYIVNWPENAERGGIEPTTPWPRRTEPHDYPTNAPLVARTQRIVDNLDAPKIKSVAALCSHCDVALDKTCLRAVDDGQGAHHFEATCPACHKTTGLSEQAVRNLQSL